MKRISFDGTVTALITPFSKTINPARGVPEIDFNALETLVDRQAMAGVPMVICGTTGESPTLSHEEHIQVIRVAIAVAAGRVPIVAGTGGNSTEEACDLTAIARISGADAILTVDPYYNKPTQDGLFQHHQMVAEAAKDLPVLVYVIPGRTGIASTPETIARLNDKVANIVGLKDATGNLGYTQEVLRLCGPDFAVFSGDDALTIPVMAVGGCGVISVLSNIMPMACVAITDAVQAGNFSIANATMRQLLPLINALFCETNPGPVKAALNIMCICGEELRLPMTRLEGKPRERLQAIMEEMGLLP